MVNQRPAAVSWVARTSTEPPLTAASSLSCRSARSGPSVTAETDGGRRGLRPPAGGGRVLDALRASPYVRDGGGPGGPGGGQRAGRRRRCRHCREPAARPGGGLLNSGPGRQLDDSPRRIPAPVASTPNMTGDGFSSLGHSIVQTKLPASTISRYRSAALRCGGFFPSSSAGGMGRLLDTMTAPSRACRANASSTSSFSTSWPFSRTYITYLEQWCGASSRSHSRYCSRCRYPRCR